MTQTPLKDEIIELSEKFRPPNVEKLERYTQRLDRMVGYYEQGAADETASPARVALFTRFAHAIVHTRTLIKMYRNLTRRLDKMAKEARHEEDNNSF